MAELFMQDRILGAFKSTLVAAATDAAGRVRVEGVDALGPQSVPAIEIEAGDEEVEVVSQSRSGRTLQRELRVEVRAIVACAAGDDYRGQCSRLHQQIEHALHSPQPQALDAVVPERVRLLGIRSGKDGDGARVVYLMRSMWLVRYIAKEGAA